MSLLDSPIMGRMVDFEEDVETQDEVNQENLFVYDQRTLLDQIRNLEVSKYEIDFLMDSVHDSDGEFWSLCLKEIIHVFSLDTLKNFLYDEFIQEKIIETQDLLRFLKCILPYEVRETRIPTNREDIIAYMSKLECPGYLKYALETLDNESLERFKRICIGFNV